MEAKTEKKKMNIGQLYGKFGIFFILIVLFLLSSLFVAGFLSVYNLTNVLLAIACTTTLALGATFVIILGHINIAYGSELAFIGCASCIVNVATGSVFPAIIVALLLGLAFGLFNGFVITTFSIPAFIVTLALTEAARVLRRSEPDIALAAETLRRYHNYQSINELTNALPEDLFKACAQDMDI